MNRIILIGNGFDLAHGLPTSYKSFIDYYWEDFSTKARACMSKEYDNEHIIFKTDKQTLAHIITNDSNTQYSFNKLEDQIKYFKVWGGAGAKISLTFKNKFLEIISRHSDKNWVDIENVYYQCLINFLNPSKDNKWTDISELNRDFSMIKNELEAYLIRIRTAQKLETKYIIDQIINSNFEIRDFTENGIESFAERKYREIQTFFDKTPEDTCLTKELIEKYEDYRYFSVTDFKIDFLNTEIESTPNQFQFKPDQILFLNFNYTNTESLYINNEDRHEVIHIHGELHNNINPIIFGYGDELGKEYMEIENQNDNNFLENIKSINYLQTNNYKKLLNFIESNKYQIFILGHSCGNSDRTLLNTLFEHENCVSIKPFFHKKKDGTDNYNDIVKNISRNFSNKASMRDKVVNKMYCEPFVDEYCQFALPF